VEEIGRTDGRTHHPLPDFKSPRSPRLRVNPILFTAFRPSPSPDFPSHPCSSLKGQWHHHGSAADMEKPAYLSSVPSSNFTDGHGCLLYCRQCTLDLLEEQTLFRKVFFICAFCAICGSSFQGSWMSHCSRPCSRLIEKFCRCSRDRWAAHRQPQ
jgi:hypothetical protein